jgi:hypothetical protein
LISFLDMKQTLAILIIVLVSSLFFVGEGFAQVDPPSAADTEFGNLQWAIDTQTQANNNFVGPPAPPATNDQVNGIANANDAASAAWQSTPSGSPANSTPTGTSAPASGSCNFDPNENVGPGAISAALKGCKPKGMIETKGGDYAIESGVRSRIIDIANNLILIGSILSVGAIVYAALLYTIAAGDEERIKSAKNALKFGIIGFAVMLISFGLVNAIVRLFYATSGG